MGKCSPEAIAKDVFYFAPHRKFEESDKGIDKVNFI